ncbi:hypothetical protein [Serratia sp. Se-RSBMAAmG]|uniref:hypothetical protein n=1 Tax=Serratia sp. Se-RSBMAAmG TaxID=3043305 RepID=UPI0024AED5FC|nr:hypothetical protein [Serratia sp. Se-RSBMAAmG]MDI6977253.1 hypothetical protein [Serratia sp. Se-RSBMAAmG]
MNDVKLNPGEKLDKGYLVVFTSWENDADHYRSVQTNVKTKAEALVLMTIGKMFRSKNDRPNPGFGNKEHEDYEELKELIIEALEEKITDEDQKLVLSGYIRDVWADMDGGDFYDWLTENILHYPVEYEGEFCRVVEAIELYEVLEDFIMPKPAIPIRKVD